MPRTRPLGPPPDERPNWDSLNEGQRRYAWEQYNLAKVRRGIPIDHPIPGTSNAEPAQLNQEEQDYINEFDLSLLDNNTSQGNQEEASLDEILDRPVDPVDHQNIINELQNMSNGPEPIEIDQPSSSTGGNQGNPMVYFHEDLAETLYEFDRYVRGISLRTLSYLGVQKVHQP